MNKLKEAPFVTVSLVAINVICFFVNSFLQDKLWVLGRLTAVEVLGAGQYYRIITAFFLHGGIEHLFNNMVLLLFLGMMLEQEIGHLPLLVTYFVAGIGGNVVSLWYKVISGSTAGSLGASGALFGLDGLLLAMVLLYGGNRQNLTLQRVLFMIVFSLYNGFKGTQIDNAAHVGGLLFGFFTGLIICILKRRRKYGRYGD